MSKRTQSFNQVVWFLFCLSEPAAYCPNLARNENLEKIICFLMLEFYVT